MTYNDPDTLVKSLDNFNDPIYEAGGFILNLKDEYTFVEVPNKHKGQNIGRVLYEPDADIFAKLLGPYFMKKWDLYATFHSHPAFSAHYSTIDYQNLFENAKYNYIKSILYNYIMKYTWLKDNELKSEKI